MLASLNSQYQQYIASLDMLWHCKGTPIFIQIYSNFKFDLLCRCILEYLGAANVPRSLRHCSFTTNSTVNLKVVYPISDNTLQRIEASETSTSAADSTPINEDIWLHQPQREDISAVRSLRIISFTAMVRPYWRDDVLQRDFVD